MNNKNDSSDQQYQVVGHKKKITMDVNYGTLNVVGNQCKINVRVNRGTLDVVGNRCTVTVAENHGKVNYVGEYGVIIVQMCKRVEQVQCIGSSCEVYLNNGGPKGESHSAMSPRRPKPHRRSSCGELFSASFFDKDFQKFFNNDFFTDFVT